jgi:hypothetical protein
MIISCSRRTDIPAFYGSWLMERLRAGEVAVRNPVNPKQVSRIELDSSSVECIVFWTKNPAPFMEHLNEIDAMGYNYYFQFTLTPYESDIERKLDKSKIIETFIRLSERIGRERVIWRYDPILINEKWTAGVHAEKFMEIIAKLYTRTEKCVISFIDSYPFLKKSFAENRISGPDAVTINEIAQNFSAIKNAYAPAMQIATCCEKVDLAQYGIVHNKCIDDELVSRVTGAAIKYRKDPSQRLACGCLRSRDIGAYNTCRHDCLYCYAKRPGAVTLHSRSHDVNLFAPKSVGSAL